MKLNQLSGGEAKRSNADFGYNPLKKSGSAQKSNYIGLTLKEYLILGGKERMEEIEEESVQSFLTNSPALKTTLPFQNRQDNSTDKHKLKSKHKEELLSIVNNILHHPESKIPKINMEQFTCFEKQAQKLPTIHQQRAVKSRNAVKDENQQIRKDRCYTLKPEEMQPNNEPNFSLPKNSDKMKPNDLGKHSMEMKKAVRSRIVSTTLYHIQLKQKEKMRLKTEDQNTKHLENSFMITRYREGLKGKQRVEDSINIFKKH